MPEQTEQNFNQKWQLVSTPFFPVPSEASQKLASFDFLAPLIANNPKRCVTWKEYVTTNTPTPPSRPAALLTTWSKKLRELLHFRRK